MNEIVRKPPMDDELAARKAAEFIAIAEQENTLGLMQCIAAVGISQRQFYSYKEKFPVLDDAFERARTIIGARREYLALKGRINPLMVIRMAGFYDDEYRKIQFDTKEKGEDGLYELLKRLNTKRGRMDDNRRRTEARREARDQQRIEEEERQEKSDSRQLRFAI